jgi:hypothetical protein
MITVFTTAKPFKGLVYTSQRNALRSWLQLHPDVEVILFGEDEGAAEAAEELGIRHEPYTEKNQSGSNQVNYMFSRAQAIARNDVLCYSNCDIILMQDFRRAVEHVYRRHREFLMVGRRWDMEITEACDFQSSDWQVKMRELALRTGRQRTSDWIDYFVFSRGLFVNLPPLVVGRVFWDNWTVWHAIDLGKPVVDASREVLAVHQNHDYGHHPQGKQGVWFGEEATANYKFAGGWKHLRTMDDATERLTADGLKPNRLRYWAAVKRYIRQVGRFGLYDVWQPVWFYVLGITRPLRSVLGLRTATLRGSRH